MTKMKIKKKKSEKLYRLIRINLKISSLIPHSFCPAG